MESLLGRPPPNSAERLFFVEKHVRSRPAHLYRFGPSLLLLRMRSLHDRFCACKNPPIVMPRYKLPSGKKLRGMEYRNSVQGSEILQFKCGMSRSDVFTAKYDRRTRLLSRKHLKHDTGPESCLADNNNLLYLVYQ